MLKFLKRLFVKIFGLDKPLSDTDLFYDEKMRCETEEEWIYRRDQTDMW